MFYKMSETSFDDSIDDPDYVDSDNILAYDSDSEIINHTLNIQEDGVYCIENSDDEDYSNKGKKKKLDILKSGNGICVKMKTHLG